jgi:hypothetical protein
MCADRAKVWSLMHLSASSDPRRTVGARAATSTVVERAGSAVS